MARPRKTVDAKRVIELASNGRTLREIAALENVSEDTIYRHCADAYHKGVELRNGRLRSKQFSRAMAGSDKMLIWLGKQLLGQTEKEELTGKIQHEHSIDLTGVNASILAELRPIAEEVIGRSGSGRVLPA